MAATSLRVKVGFAYDDAFRQVIGIDPDAQYQSAVCGDNPIGLPAAAQHRPALPGPHHRRRPIRRA